MKKTLQDMQTRFPANDKGVMVVNGKMIDLFNLQAYPSQLEVSNMARGLTGVIRFNGYSNWSVAQHCLMLSFLTDKIFDHLVNCVQKNNISPAKTDMQELFGDPQNVFAPYPGDKGELFDSLFEGANKGKNKKLKQTAFNLLRARASYDALIHDFHEALTGDIISPMKRLIEGVADIEHFIDAQIREHYEAYPQMPAVVNMLDKMMASIEAYHLTRYYGVSLVNTSEPFQVKAFNAPFVRSETAVLVTRKLFNHDTEFDTNTPLSERFVNSFLNCGQKEDKGVALFDEIYHMNKTALTLRFVAWFLKLRRHIRACEDALAS